MSACAALACGLITSSQVFAEVYRWTDENGVTHFSETPPPNGQEAQVEDLPDDVAGPVNDESGIDPSTVLSDVADSEASPADLQRQALAEKRAQRKAEQSALEASCRQAVARLSQIEPSRRVFYTNDEGEMVRMDDDQRVGEIDELQDFIDKNCKQ